MGELGILDTLRWCDFMAGLLLSEYSRMSIFSEVALVSAKDVESSFC